MNPGEYEQMARTAEVHWWYQGLRDALTRTLRSTLRQPQTALRILDAGCGTGENLRLFSKLLAPEYLGGFDSSYEALAIAARKAPQAEIYRSDICEPEVRTTLLDVVTSLDVIYIPGAERARPGLVRLVEALRPGGLLIINLPAYNWLFSEHDVAVHTSQRFTLGQVRRLLIELGLSVEQISYRLCLLFPLVVASRLARRERARKGDPTARSDLHRLPGASVNGALLATLRLENALLVRGLRWPFGSSIFAVGRKP